MENAGSYFILQKKPPIRDTQIGGLALWCRGSAY